MKQNKNLHKITLLTVSALLVLTAPKAFSITLDELTDPMPPAYRLGVSATPEKAFKVSDSEKKAIMLYLMIWQGMSRKKTASKRCKP